MTPAAARGRAVPASPNEARRFLMLSVLIGISTGLLIVCFHTAIDLVAWTMEDAATSSVLRVLVPGVGAALATLLVRRLVPSAGGSGIVHTKSALYVSNGRIPVVAVPGKFVACSLSIGTGTPLGPEDPSLMMGAGMASLLGRTFRLSQRSMRQVAPIGAAAGIAAAFNTPITGVLFVIEEVIAAWDAAVLGSIVLAAASAVVTTRVFLGDSPLFRVPELGVMADPREAVVFVLLGIGAGLLATSYSWGVTRIRHRVAGDARIPAAAGPFVAGMIAGAAGLWLPEVLGPGYRAMDAALHSQYSGSMLALLGVAKLVVAAIAFGAGSPGGLFAPTLFIGAMVGGAAGTFASDLVPFAVSPASLYVLVGMAGVFAGVFRAPMTAVFMAFELSATSAIIVPAMITATLGYLTARQIRRRSLLDEVAELEGVVLPSAQAQREHEPLRVEDALQPSNVPVLPASATPVAARRALGSSRSGQILVHVAERGWCTLEAGSLTRSSQEPDDLPLEAHPALRRLAVVHPDELLDVALRQLARERLVPVVSRLDVRLLVGVVTLADVHRAYGLLAGGRGSNVERLQRLDGVGSRSGDEADEEGRS